MVETGAARLRADGIVGWLEPVDVIPLLAGFFLLTILLTQPMSNAAAALVVLPVALETGHTPRTVLLACLWPREIPFHGFGEGGCGTDDYSFDHRANPDSSVLAAVAVLGWESTRPQGRGSAGCGRCDYFVLSFHLE